MLLRKQPISDSFRHTTTFAHNNVEVKQNIMTSLIITLITLTSLLTLTLSFPLPLSHRHNFLNSFLTPREEVEVAVTPPLAGGIDPSSNPPYQMYNILSTPTTITFLLTDPNPNAPTPDGGYGTPVRCSATFALPDGTMDMSQIPYDPQPCVDLVTGNAESSSLFAWQIMDYGGPGLWVVRVWHGYLDHKYVEPLGHFDIYDPQKC
jgi:hypothetical protein